MSQQQQNTPQQQTTGLGFGSITNSFGQPQQQAIQQQSLFSGSGGGLQLGQQQPFQQQPQQTLGSSFGSAFGQQQSIQQQSIQQQSIQQQEQSLFGITSGGLGGGGGRSVTDSMGTDGSPYMKWVAASNGHIPEGAVVGGWSSTTQEPYYIARAKRDRGLYPGVVLKSKKVCSFVNQVNQQKSRGYGLSGSSQSNYDTNPNYEVLVTSSGKEEEEEEKKRMTWVYLGPSRVNNTFIGNCITTRLKVGYNLQGSPNFVGRAPSMMTGDLVPGEFKGNAILITENDHYSAHNLYQSGCEVLCVSPQDPGDSDISNCYLYDIEYDIDKRKSISWSDKKLGRVTLVNESSVEQRMTPSFRVTYSTNFKWELSKPDSEYKQVKIKGEVPFVFGYSEDDCYIVSLNSQSFFSHITMDDIAPGAFSGFGVGGNPVCNIHGGRLPLPAGGGLFSGGPQVPNIKVTGIFNPTVVIVDNLSNGVSYKKRTVCNSTFVTVPPRSKVTMEYTGQEVTLTVPFKATLKIIYRNDCVVDKEVHGTYKHSSITASFPTVVGEERILAVDI